MLFCRPATRHRQDQNRELRAWPTPPWAWVVTGRNLRFDSPMFYVGVCWSDNYYLLIGSPKLFRRKATHSAKNREGDMIEVLWKVLVWSTTYLLIALVPDGHEGMAFRAGQYAWLTVGDTPLTLQQHPFSFASSDAVSGRIEFGIKELGDFIATIKNLRAGDARVSRRTLRFFHPRSTTGPRCPGRTPLAFELGAV